tara:strand:- start:3100 stop:4320 length:1221 start_codon:yes stop_codon:yes gene_type:complete
MNSYQYLKRKETLIPILLIVFSVVLRIPVIFIWGDTNLENEWGILVNNLILHGTLSLKSFDSFLLPNLWMPPLYAYYIYLFSFFNIPDQSFVLLILSSQVLLSSISIAIFYNINKFFFSSNISLFNSILFSVFPLYLYACAQISSITLHIFLAMLFYYYFFKIIKKKDILSIVAFSFIAGLLILTRREFVAIFILSCFYLFIFNKLAIKRILIIVLITLITVSPYLIRNALIFEKITIQAGFGYNVWKANNPNSKVEGSTFIDDNLQKQIDKVTKDRFYRINEDKIFLNQAIKNIKENPRRYFILYFKKIASFLFIDINSSEPNYYNPFHYLPIILITLTSLGGIIVSDKKSLNLNYLILIFFFYIFLFSFFAILPRYKLSIIPLQIIFTGIVIEYIYNKYFSSYK